MTKRTRGVPAKDADGFNEGMLKGASSHVGFLGVEPPIKLRTFLKVAALSVLAFVAASFVR